jgi:two-component system, chemotaxis family, chemotaxis protein CheY
MQERETVKMSFRRVLVVEDDDAIANALESILMDEGFMPVSVRTARDALAALAMLPNTPGLILLDLMLPGMNGAEFVDELRADDRWLDVPVVVVSASGEAEEVSAMIGAVAALKKPFHIEALVDTVRTHYRRDAA